MKNFTTKIVTLSFITATMLHATNGDHLIATGAKARAMGGASIGMSHGSESGLSNPALITSVENTEVSFGGTLFMPTIESTFNGGVPPQSHVSDADTNMIPEVSIAHKINENWYIGVGMWGTAGMGTDYSKAAFNPQQGQLGNLHMVTNLQLLQFAVPIAYKTGGLSIAVTPLLQYGNLDINYQMPTATGIANVGAGLAQDFGFGYNLGIAYDFAQNDVNGLTLGAVYKSAIEMNYANQLTTATGPFNQPPFPNVLSSDILEQPAEVGIGFSYVSGQHTFAMDYKVIQWSGAKGYSEFGWEDQDIYAFGYQYETTAWALRAGYNHASSAVVEVQDPRLNFFNLLGFPATSEDHYTFGGTYNISKAFSMDLAYVYSPESSKTFNVAPLIPGVNSLTTLHKETSLTFQLVYNF